MSAFSSIIIEINFPSAVAAKAQAGTQESATDAKAAETVQAVEEIVDNPVCIKDLEPIAKRKISSSAWSYYSTGAMDEETMRNNVDSFSRIRIRPRVLRDVSNIDTTVTLFGHTYASPVGISPTAMMKLCHADGEAGVARAVAGLNQAQTLSTFTTMSLEDVAKAARSVPDYPFKSAARIPNLWFQLYIVEDRHKAEQLVRRADAAGYSALVVTVDTPQLGRRLHTIREPFKLPTDMTHANFEGNSDSLAAINTAVDASVNWNRDISWLRSITKLPIIVKGILTAEDAELAVQAGVDAIGVSNHGGRQLDSVPSSIEALPEIARAVKGRVPIILDGGVRKGTDVFKALALGATYVCVGRPSLYALAYDGEEGVRKMLGFLNEELRLAMTLAGATKVKDINRNFIRAETEYSRL
ncbi:FMN-dependent alpha-hydroxy acid dehydrogenase [Gonapodya prolifera JEL478]|uniref:Oxidase FUB9 n=1 Tax=Gonapodya prolifera (strain JEL478) TaxID=1344416 RepID=A0A139AN13_GONPJ|nr:FMN-dependent alpha-hydroxy acid dehydrogenase [Gonapodya prolifera JEL478]|eukprot:KXS17994.1 FMN-dependent alpha-hydroxy acid dehydrogenase [Gonapodya prolifera JEL478]